MGLFRPYERQTDATPALPESSEGAASGKPEKKGIPTPSRKEAEAARRERLNPTLSPKESRARERQTKRAQRDEYFVKAESTPNRVLMRDLVDAHRGASQYTMPILMVTLAVSLMLSGVSPNLAIVVTALTYVVFGAIVLDIALLWRRYKKLAAERIPKEPLKGMLGYLINRTINLRRLRTPAPRVKPGDKI